MKEWIGYYKNVISNKISQDIMNDDWPWKSSTYSSNKGEIENSSNRVVMDDCWITEKMTYWKPLLYITKEVIKLYKETHPCMKYFNPNRTTDFRVNKYSGGGFMSEHADNIHHSHGQQYGYPSASCLFFLNDDYEGGEIVIADIMYKPEKGSAIIFPSNFMFPHYVNKVTKNERYSIITWIM